MQPGIPIVNYAINSCFWGISIAINANRKITIAKFNF